VGTAATTCNNWASALGTGIVGKPSSSAAPWWNAASGIACSTTTYRLYCVEQ
jgi:hypothetical protein